jgi:hypothetical protein
MRRLRRIADLTAEHERALEEAYADSDLAARWRKTVERWDFSEVNELIEKHNAYYPIEARLAMDPRTGDFTLVRGKPYTLEPLDAAWVFRRLPPRA